MSQKKADKMKEVEAVLETIKEIIKDELPDNEHSDHLQKTANQLIKEALDVYESVLGGGDDQSGNGGII